MLELLIALVSALGGSGFTWLLGASDRAQAKKALEGQQKLLEAQQQVVDAQQTAAEAQTRIAKLETERDQREFFNQFSPKASFAFEHPKGNSLTLQADEPFIVESIDYLTSSGASVGSQPIGQSSKSLEIPIRDDYLGQARAFGPNRNDTSMAVQFRIHIQKDGLRKVHFVNAVVNVVWVQTPQGKTQSLKLIG